MSFSHWITVAAVAFLPLAATAQQAQQSNPSDANASVAEATYVSAFKSYLTTPEEQETPDQVWRAANEQVAQGDPHAGHGAMPGMKAAPAAQKPGSAQPDPHAGHGAQMTTPKASSAPPDPHAGHSGHNMQGK